MRRALLLLLVLAACGPYPRAWLPGGPDARRPISGTPGGSGGSGAGGSGAAGTGGEARGGSGGRAGEGGGGGALVDCRRGSTRPGDCCGDDDCAPGTTCAFDPDLCTSGPGTCVPCSRERPYPYCRCDGTVIEGCSIGALTYWSTCGYAPGEFFCGDESCTRDGQACLIEGDTYRCVPERGVCQGPDCATMVATGLCPSGAFGRSNGQDVYVYCN